jgi:hypothetical protein
MLEQNAFHDLLDDMLLVGVQGVDAFEQQQTVVGLELARFQGVRSGIRTFSNFLRCSESWRRKSLPRERGRAKLASRKNSLFTDNSPAKNRRKSLNGLGKTAAYTTSARRAAPS